MRVIGTIPGSSPHLGAKRPTPPRDRSPPLRGSRRAQPFRRRSSSTLPSPSGRVRSVVPRERNVGNRERGSSMARGLARSIVRRGRLSRIRPRNHRRRPPAASGTAAPPAIGRPWVRLRRSSCGRRARSRNRGSWGGCAGWRQGRIRAGARARRRYRLRVPSQGGVRPQPGAAPDLSGVCASCGGRDRAARRRLGPRDHVYPVETVLAMGRSGLFGLPFPQEYGGGKRLPHVLPRDRGARPVRRVDGDPARSWREPGLRRFSIRAQRHRNRSTSCR